MKWQSVLAKYFAASPDEFRQKTRGAYRRLTKRNIFLTRRQARDRPEFSETRKLPRHFGRRHPFFFFSFCSGARRKPVIKWPLFFYERATWAPPCGPQFRLPRPDAFGTAGALRVIFVFISPGFFYIRIYSSFLLSLGEPPKSFRTPAAKNDSAKLLSGDVSLPCSAAGRKITIKERSTFHLCPLGSYNNCGYERN